MATKWPSEADLQAWKTLCKVQEEREKKKTEKVGPVAVATPVVKGEPAANKSEGLQQPPAPKLDEWRAKLDSANEQLNALLKEQAALQVEHKELLARAEKQATTITSLMEKTNPQVQTLENEKQRLETTLESVTQERDALEMALTNVDNEREMFKVERDTALTNLERAKKEASTQLAAKITKLENELIAAKNNATHWQAAFNNLKKNNDLVKAENEMLKKTATPPVIVTQKEAVETANQLLRLATDKHTALKAGVKQMLEGAYDNGVLVMLSREKWTEFVGTLKKHDEMQESAVYE